MAERAAETLVKLYSVKKEDAKAYVSDVFSIVDSVTAEKGYKPIAEEKKADIAVASAAALNQFIKEMAKKLKL
jgi:hypothetical protein